MKTLKHILFFFTAIFLLSACTVLTRYVKYGSEDIDDYKIFPTYQFQENPLKYTFAQNTNTQLDSLLLFLDKTSTRSFIVIRNDSVLYEKYFRNYSREDISTVFSVSKSVTSLLIGIALYEGYIKDVNEPITNYIEELAEANPYFKKLTIKHLLDMRTGLKFDEDSRKIFSSIAYLYYGKNQLDVIKSCNFNLNLIQNMNTKVFQRQF
ncbi:MAG: 6-aminohexanoate-dimer hydrolase [Bacteroidetes bacterium ADurb.BinA174]|nr:MAG: 6-aminohexanoate-dimer hydrolase [Bacteroidetes bacterium ADurb.BinA174]